MAERTQDKAQRLLDRITSALQGEKVKLVEEGDGVTQVTRLDPYTTQVRHEDGTRYFVRIEA